MTNSFARDILAVFDYFRQIAPDTLDIDPHASTSATSP
jgi:hypothetical protein